MTIPFDLCPFCLSANIFVNVNNIKCNDCNRHYFQNIATAVAVIIESEGKILFTKRAKNPCKGMLDLPGGFLNPNETAENAAKRELKEELNLEVQTLQYLTSIPNIYYYKSIKYFTCDLFFIHRTINSHTFDFELQKSEIAGICWISKNNIPIKKIGMKSIQEFFINYRKTFAKNLKF